MHHCYSLALHSAVVLNLQPDHLEWYGDPAEWGSTAPDGITAYAADKARIYHHVTHACIYNVADETTLHMVEEAEVTEGARAMAMSHWFRSSMYCCSVDDARLGRKNLPWNRVTAATVGLSYLPVAFTRTPAQVRRCWVFLTSGPNAPFWQPGRDRAAPAVTATGRRSKRERTKRASSA